MKLVSAGLRATRSRLSYANVMATLAAVAAIGGGAIAAGAIPDEEGEINACYVKRGDHKGEVRLLVRGKCGRGEKLISWNQEGPQGETGLQGEQGAQGETGPSTGPAGGALAGTYPNPTLNVSGGPCANGKALTNVSALAALTCAPGVYSDAVSNLAVVPSPFGALTTGTSNSAFGDDALSSNTTGDNNSALGEAALFANTTGADNSAVGQGALDANTTGSSNSAVGENALGANTGGGFNSAFGQGALDANTVGNFNSAFGENALGANNTASDNTAVGESALGANSTGTRNAAFGQAALGANFTANDNTAVGEGSLDANNTGTRNSALGQDALGANTTASDNTAVGEDALGASSGATGGSNSAFGQGALDASTAGGSNTAFGQNALGSVSTGADNTAFGQAAGNAISTGSSNIAIGNSGVGAESNTIRIGTQGTGLGQQSRAFMAGVRDVTTTNAAIPVLVDTVGQLGTTSSSRRFKTDVHPIGSPSDRLMRLRPVSFRYKRSHASGRWPLQYGLIAEQVERIYPELVVDGRDGRPYTVAYQQLPPLLLAQAQREHARTSRVQARLDRHRRTIERLDAAVAALKRRGHR